MSGSAKFDAPTACTIVRMRHAAYCGLYNLAESAIIP